MTLSRSAPLTTNTDHSWSRDGRNYWTCENSGCTAREFSPDGPPDVGYACEGGLKKSGGPDRSSGPRPVAKGGRKGREDPETGVKIRYGPCWEWVSKNLPCVACGRLDGAPADHWVPVGRGGKDPGNCLPCCRQHQDRHQEGEKTWPEKYGVDVEEELRVAWEAFRAARLELAEKLRAHLPKEVPGAVG